jgi:hypothetical protein
MNTVLRSWSGVKQYKNFETVAVHCAVRTELFLARSEKCEKRLLASSYLSFRMEQLGSHWTDFHEILYLRIFRKYVEKIQVSLKSDKNNGYFT